MNRRAFLKMIGAGVVCAYTGNPFQEVKSCARLYKIDMLQDNIMITCTNAGVKNMWVYWPQESLISFVKRMHRYSGPNHAMCMCKTIYDD